jgi:hypothetical protein
VGGVGAGGKSEVKEVFGARKTARMVEAMGDAPFFAATWLEPLRVYPRWLVLLCVAVMAGGVLALVAKPLKWGLYAGLAGLLVAFLAGFAWWLEA